MPTKDAPKTWGISAAEFYADLRNKNVQIITTDSKLYKGTLIGVDVYDVTIKQDSGLVMLIAKHAIKTIYADAPASEAAH